MDNNVSKETFLHKFFLVPLSQEKNFISPEYLLRYRLFSIFDLYRQQQDIVVDPLFLDARVFPKIALLDSSIECRSLTKQSDLFLFPSQSKIIVYASSIVLVIAAHLQKTPQIVAEEWSNIWDFELKNISTTSFLTFKISLEKSGWLYFYLDEKSLAVWLERSLQLFSLKTAINSNMPQNKLFAPENSAINLFPIQYTHARCCSLLRLAVKEKIVIHNQDIIALNWLNYKDRLYCQEEAEIYLLRQLFLIADSFKKEIANWQKLALDFSQTIMVFLAECRFLGEVHRKTPQLAIARLGLIALSQYWLQRIIVEKLNISAPTDL